MLVEFGLWANETALCASVLLIIGGLWNVIVQSSRWGIGLYCFLGGLVFFLLEYPRSKRQHGRGNTPHRLGQELVERLASSILKLKFSYLARFLSMLLFSFPGLLNIETLCGALTLAYSSLLYLIAAVKNERWLSPTSKPPTSSAGVDNAAFTVPPRPTTEAANRI